MTTFDDPAAVAAYADKPRRLVPGHDALLTLTDLLLAERMPPDGHLFVLGAGGGLEMALFARNHPDWQFTGVDPSAEMLTLATRTMGDTAARARLICGYVQDAPQGPYDAATCILTLHFVPRPERVPTLQAVRARLKPGAPFVCAHHSVPETDRAQWFTRFAAFAEMHGINGHDVRKGASRMATELPILSPTEDEALLAEAGFTQITQFYHALTFRGWVCSA